jgi:hypothetical protein
VILPRVLISIATVLVVAAIFAILLVDSRSNSEKALEYINSDKFFKVLELYDSKTEKFEEDIALLSLALSGIEMKINFNQNTSLSKEWLEDLEDYPDIKHNEFTLNGTNCTNIEDNYFKILKKNTYWYQKSLLKKINSTLPCNTAEKNSEYLNRLILEDPRNFMKETGFTLVELFRSPLEPIGEIEGNFLKETLHFFSTQEVSPFYENLYILLGDKVNFRAGPGIEYPSKLQLLKNEEMICFDKDNRSETIGGKVGNWMECFSENRFKSGWVFSGQTQKINSDSNNIEKFNLRFSNNKEMIQISFDTWKENSIPSYFYGDYIPTERYLRKGEVGFTIYKAEDNKTIDICRKFVGKKNSFEMFFNSLDSKQLMPIIKFNVINSNTSKPVFKFLANYKEMQLNDKKIELIDMSSKESIKIKISSTQVNHLIGNVYRKNTLILSNIISSTLESNLWQDGKTYWEICIPQSKKQSKDKSYIFGLEILNES